jgi:hypothetical protein
MGDPEEARRRAGRGFGHTKYDTVDKADLRAQRECVANAALAAIRILNDDNWPVAHRTQIEVDKLIQAQDYEETVKLGEKLKAYLTERRDSLRPEAVKYLERLTGSPEEVI